jgi:hypothetical protein
MRVEPDPPNRSSTSSPSRRELGFDHLLDERDRLHRRVQVAPRRPVLSGSRSSGSRGAGQSASAAQLVLLQACADVDVVVDHAGLGEVAGEVVPGALLPAVEDRLVLPVEVLAAEGGDCFTQIRTCESLNRLR